MIVADDELWSGLAETTGLFRPEPYSETIHGVPRLLSDLRDYGDVVAFRRNVKIMRTATTQTLVLRIATTADPLLLWAIHLVLDGRGVAPVLRWPANTSSPQEDYLTWLADIHWFVKRNPSHEPCFRGWKGLFKHEPVSDEWHATAYRQYLFVAARYSVAHWCSKGLGLTETQRLPLLTLPTNKMQAERRQLAPDKIASLRECLLSTAMERPDRSGQHSPEAIANRRIRMWQVFVLSGYNHTATATNWHLLTGESLSRQAISKQLVIVGETARKRSAT